MFPAWGPHPFRAISLVPPQGPSPGCPTAVFKGKVLLNEPIAFSPSLLLPSAVKSHYYLLSHLRCRMGNFILH